MPHTLRARTGRRANIRIQTGHRAFRRQKNANVFYADLRFITSDSLPQPDFRWDGRLLVETPQKQMPIGFLPQCALSVSGAGAAVTIQELIPLNRNDAPALFIPCFERATSSDCGIAPLSRFQCIAQPTSATNGLRDRTRAFLGRLYELSAGGKIDAAIDEVIDHFEPLLRQGDWMTCNNVLLRADIASLDMAVSLAMLSMTLVVKDQVTMRAARAAFYSRLRQIVTITSGEKKAAQLLHGLK